MNMNKEHNPEQPRLDTEFFYDESEASLERERIGLAERQAQKDLATESLRWSGLGFNKGRIIYAYDKK
jgi:hypothetical protein